MSADEEEQQILEEILQENDSEDEFLQEYEKVSKQLKKKLFLIFKIN